MTDYTELKRLASAAKNWGGEVGEDQWYTAECFKQPHFSVPDAEFIAVCEPGAVLALIAENERIKKERRTEHQSLRSDKARNSLYMMIATSLIDDHPYERGGSDWDYEHPIHDKIISLLAERDQLLAQVAVLKTGYEAYEQVNAELKQKVANLEVCQTASLGMSGIIKCVAGELGFDASGEDSAQDYLIGLARQASGLKAECEALRKRIDDMSPFKGAPLTGPDLKCLACGGYHYGLHGSPCPNMRITASAAMGQGDRS